MSTPAAAATRLPPSVRAAAERANKLVADLKTPPTDPPATPPVAATPPATPPVEPPATPPATPPVAALPPATPPTTPPADPPAETMEHKYRVLQGKYNAEVPRLQRAAREQDGEIRDLKQQLLNTQSLLASMNARTPPAVPPAAPAAPLVTDAEIKEFGADLIDVMGRVAKQTLLPEIESRVKPVAAEVKTVARAAQGAQEANARTAREKVLDLLHNQVPNFQQVNVEPGFLTWLAEPDPYAGRLREDLLQEAYKANDGPRVIAFFKGYLAENAATTPPPAAPPPPPPPAASTEAQRTLESLVAPGTPKSGPGSAPTDASKRVWTRAEIGDLYKQIHTYTVKNRKVPDELRAQERDMMRAQTEGRVR